MGLFGEFKKNIDKALNWLRLASVAQNILTHHLFSVLVHVGVVIVFKGYASEFIYPYHKLFLWRIAAISRFSVLHHGVVHTFWSF